MPEQKINAAHAAKLLGVSVSFIRTQVKNGKLAYTTIGSRYFFNQDDVLNLIQTHEPHNNVNNTIE